VQTKPLYKGFSQIDAFENKSAIVVLQFMNRKIATCDASMTIERGKNTEPKPKIKSYFFL
jgi:hypothetical protein